MTISIKPTASGSTIEQDGSTILTVDGSGNISIANDLSVTGTAPIPDALSTATGSAPSYSARAWVYFDGTGTPSINASGNVSSITDYGVGQYGVNFTTNMPDANFSSSGATGGSRYHFLNTQITAESNSFVRISVEDTSTDSLDDDSKITVIVVG